MILKESLRLFGQTINEGARFKGIAEKQVKIYDLQMLRFSR